MFFLNLTAAEFFALLGTLGSLVTALYLLDRARRRRVVSTLQFWASDAASDRHQARRKMRDPWSLILQLASLLLLLLAASDFEWGSHARQGRDHVLLFDTSSWAAAQTAQPTPRVTVLEREKEEAKQYCSLLPASDRIMLVAADSLATPLTRFTHDKRELAAAIDRIAPGYAALNLRAATAFARQAQTWSGHKPGEIVYVGPELTDSSVAPALLPDRILPVPANREDCGIRQFSVEQASDDANSFRALVRLKNYGQNLRSFALQTRFGDTNFAPRHLSLQPGAEQTVEYSFTTKGSGTLSVAIPPGDSLAIDDRAALTISESNPVRVLVYTDRPESLKPLLASNRQLATAFEPPAKYAARPAADVIILDHFAPAQPPSLPSLWIDPPGDRSPLPISGNATDALVTWVQNGSLTQALHTKPLHLPVARSYQMFEGDKAIATADGRPVVVLRGASGARASMAVVGFDPAAGPLRFEVATPLLFAALLEELNPMAFRTSTFAAQEVGLASVALDREEQRGIVRVRSESGAPIPFTRHAADLQLFVQQPQTVSISSEERERVIELRLPAVAEHILERPSTALGLPPNERFVPALANIWKDFALAGVGCLLLEWFLFGPGRRQRLLKRKTWHTAGNKPEAGKPKRELVVK